ncbi:hypothetical protein [Alkalicoccus daliensis]|uniref:Tfp pilus assembly protein PilN n=1 Tax=Alkalicoccus daliensis TaxID=745820 RepID=A0A1H0CM94_9BACI|nr:hypothetical protein [Alkalicoccus daliensis]SDN59010.1 hypothetical protein SAMN04488053_102157 [Alkalicoccus daliensis]
MPIEINLLPGKKRRTRTLPMLLLLIGVLGLIGLLAIISIGSSMENERRMAEEELAEARIASAELENELEELQESDILLLNTVIGELEEKVVPASSVLMDIVSRMPADSGLTMFEYEYPDHITLEILLMSMPDLARFQHELEDSPLIQQAEIDIVMGEAILEELDENIFWYEEYLPQYFATIVLVLHPDAIRAYEQEETELSIPRELEEQEGSFDFPEENEETEELEEPAGSPFDNENAENNEEESFQQAPGDNVEEDTPVNREDDANDQEGFSDNNDWAEEEIEEEDFDFNWEDNEENEVELP